MRNRMEVFSVDTPERQNLASNFLQSHVPDISVLANAPTGFFWLLDIDGAIVGSIAAQPAGANAPKWRLSALVIAPGWRRGGLARFLLARAKQTIVSRGGAALSTAVDFPSPAATALLRLGFTDPRELAADAEPVPDPNLTLTLTF